MAQLLTETELKALERRRTAPYVLLDENKFQWRADNAVLAGAMLRLFPEGHDADITPERLLACGFERNGYDPAILVAGDMLVYNTREPLYWRVRSKRIRPPTNMGDVWRLLDEYGIAAHKSGSGPILDTKVVAEPSKEQA